MIRGEAPTRVPVVAWIYFAHLQIWANLSR